MTRINEEFRIRTLERAIADNPNDPTLLVELARVHMQSEQPDWAQAVRILERATKVSGNYPQASFELGIAYTRMRNYDSAIREWEKMVDEDGDLELEGIDHTRYGAIAGCVKEWGFYAQNAEENIFKYYHLGIAGLVLGRFNDALTAFNRVAQINPGFEKSLYYKARALHRLGRGREAIDDLVKFLEYRPRDPHANYFLGLILLEEGRTGQAINFFKRSFTDRPQYMKSHIQLATAYANLMQFDEAIGHLETALKVRPDLAAAHYQMGRCLEKKYMMNEAADAYEQAVRANPNFKDAHLALGLLYRNLAEHEKALRHLQRTVELDPDESEAYYYMGIVLSALKRFDEAIPHLRDAVKLSPSNAFAHYTLGKACMGCEQLEEAIQCFRSALEINPRDAKSRTALGQAYFQLKELTRAKRQFEKVIEANPNAGEAHYFLGACQMRLHDYGGAIVSYQNAAQINPNSALDHFTRGAVASYKRQYAEALKAFQEAAEFRPETETDLGMFSTLQLLATVGIAHAQTGLELQRFAQKRDELFKIFVMALASFLDARDKYTRYHSRRVAQIGTLLAERGLGSLVEQGRLGPEYLLPEDMITGITVGGLLHDIGKIGIPDQVLNKPGKLTDEEYDLIKQHPVIGAEGLKNVPFPWPEVLPIVRHHHEKWNGKGYPDLKAGDDIPFEAQIIGVADFYDALTTNRPYRKAFTPMKALTIMKEEVGTFFNPILIEAFELIIDEVILVPEAPIDETGQYVLGEMDDAFDSLRMSWNFGAAAQVS